MTDSSGRDDEADTPEAHDREGNRFSRRMQRYASIGSTAGGVAARMGASYLFGGKDHQKQAAQLAAALGGLKGPLMKVAQLLATIPDAIPPEYANELAQLQNQAPAMGWPFVRRRMAAELGPDWRAKFQSFGEQAAAAASLGQSAQGSPRSLPVARSARSSTGSSRTTSTSRSSSARTS